MDDGREDRAHPEYRPDHRRGDPSRRAVRAVAHHERREDAPERAAGGTLSLRDNKHRRPCQHATPLPVTIKTETLR